MARRPALVLVAFGLVMVLLHLGLAAPVRAEGSDASSALDRLTEAERLVLDERLEGFAEMPLRRREQIAANVIRLRGLEGEARARFLERVRALERHRDEHGRLPRALDQARNPQRRDAIRRRGVIVRGVGQRMWTGLSGEARKRIKSTLGRRGRGVVELVFAQRLLATRARALVAAEGPLALPEALPPRAKRRVEQLVAQAQEGDDKARLKLAHLAVGLERQALLETVPASGRVDAETLERIGAAVEAQGPVAFQETLAEVERAARDGRTLERYARAGGGPGRGGSRPPGHAAKLRRLGKALEEARPALQADPRLRGPAERLDRALRKALEAGGPARRVPPPREDRGR